MAERRAALRVRLTSKKEIAMENSDGQRAAESARETISDSTRRIKDSAADLVDRGKAAAAETLERGVERAADGADQTASALRRAADDVESDNRWIGAALRKSADGLEQATRSLSGGDVSRVLDDLNGFARRNPAVFLGASLALGFALARVGKTAVEEAREDSPSDQVGDGYYSSMPGM
jgi:hypothetical protein